MKKYIIPVIILLLIAGCAEQPSSHQGVIFFDGSYEDALKRAQSAGKMVMINFYADW